MMRRLFTRARAWLRSQAELLRIVRYGPRPVELPPESGRWYIGPPFCRVKNCLWHGQQHWPPCAPSTPPAPAGQQEEHPMTKKSNRKRKSVKRAKPRLWLHVVPRGTGDGQVWRIVQRTRLMPGTRPGAKPRPVTGGRAIGNFDRKKEALAYARNVGRCTWREQGVPVQLVIHGRARDGRQTIKADATYGCDPKRSKG